MRPCQFVKCADFPCSDVNKSCYLVPDIEVKPERITAIMVYEARLKLQAITSMRKAILSTYRQLCRPSTMQDSKSLPSKTCLT